MEPDRPQTRETIILGLILTLLAGLVDAIGYLTLRHVLPANMSGNTVEGGLHGLFGNGSKAAWRLWAVGMFVVGGMLSASLHARGRRRTLGRAVPLALGLEVVLLVAWILLHHGDRASPVHATPSLAEYAQLTSAALALGVQNASLTQIGPVHAFTTHVTGTLTRFAEAAVESGLWLKDQWGQRSARPHLLARALREREVRAALIMIGLWAAFFGGAVLGGALHGRWGIDGLLLPVVALTGIAAWTWRAPARVRR